MKKSLFTILVFVFCIVVTDVYAGHICYEWGLQYRCVDDNGDGFINEFTECGLRPTRFEVLCTGSGSNISFLVPVVRNILF